MLRYTKLHSQAAFSHRNRILNAFEPELARRINENLEGAYLRRNTVLYDESTSNRYVYFPETSVVSLMSTVEDGSTLAVGMFGVDSLIIIPPVLSHFTGPLRMIAHIPGSSQRISSETFQAIAQTSPALQALIQYDAQTFALRVAQVATCGALHSVRERCVRSLLMIHDSVLGDTFSLTHDALASMVGARRASMTVAMQSLKEAGFILYRNGLIHILDRAGLESATCSCAETLQSLDPAQAVYLSDPPFIRQLRTA